jgi:hypothetical protein
MPGTYKMVELLGTSPGKGLGQFVRINIGRANDRPPIFRPLRHSALCSSSPSPALRKRRGFKQLMGRPSNT